MMETEERTQEKVLVIDDEKTTLKMFRLILDVYGFEILTAESGEKGLEIFDLEKPEIVLTDIKMPGMDGIEVLKEIKRRIPSTEVIVITGHGDMDLAIQALNLDAADFINKPIKREKLENGIERARERIRVSHSRGKQVSITLEHKIPVIQIQGNVSAHSERFLKEACKQVFNQGVKQVVFCFDPSTSVNGAGIAVLTQLVLESEKQGVEIIMAGLSQNFKQVFDIVGLSRMVRLYPTLEEALAAGL
ncbi:MAG: response regulator [Desulfotignum sp.]|nr:response regulator [Desulfotignum sp.]